ncbi:MAG TPA: hypothetical protein DEA40_16220 [Parvularcula sp.]|nr:hypothetical protein [Parvularcula sp.]HBS35148.1 hypothetical protein [Parvularcula sp.]
MRAIGVLAILAAALTATGAGAELMVAPLRQVVTAKTPVVRYQISNPSDRFVDARIGWIDLSATPEGYAAASPALRPGLSAAPYLVVSPARLRLPPGARAEVVVRLKKGAAIPAGERRSHLLIETTPARTPLRRASAGLEADVGIGVSTPVILRGGYAAPLVAFEESKLIRDENGALAFETVLKSDGKYSAYGTLEASLLIDGRRELMARIANVAVYPDAGVRRLVLPLAREFLPAGTLRVAFTGASEERGREWAVKSFEVAPPDPAPVSERR